MWWNFRLQVSASVWVGVVGSLCLSLRFIFVFNMARFLLQLNLWRVQAAFAVITIVLLRQLSNSVVEHVSELIVNYFDLIFGHCVCLSVNKLLDNNNLLKHIILIIQVVLVQIGPQMIHICVF